MQKKFIVNNYMKTLKENFFGNLGIGKKANIEQWLKKHDVYDYEINQDMTINAREVRIVNYPEEKFPDFIKFNFVGNYSLYNCPKLTSIVFPQEIDCNFVCFNCPKFKQIEKFDNDRSEVGCNIIIVNDNPFKKSDLQKVVKLHSDNYTYLSIKQFIEDIASDIYDIFVNGGSDISWDADEFNADDNLEILNKMLKDNGNTVLDIIDNDGWILTDLGLSFRMECKYIEQFIRSYYSGITRELKSLL